MPDFKYKAKDKFGRSVSGVISGSGRDDVAKHLAAIGYAPISIDETSELKGFLTNISDLFNKITLADLALFTRQLLTMQRSGVALLTCLTTLEKQTRNIRFKTIIGQIASSVEQGSSLSDALGQHPDVFPELYINMVKAGEASGALDEMLKRLAEFEEKEIDNISKVKAAMRYPMMTFLALVGAFLVMINFVIPKFAGIFGSFNKALPLPTQILLGISFFMRHYWYILVIAAAALVYLWRRWTGSKDGKLAWDALKLKIPVFGPLISMLVMARFARTLSVLLNSGLPILQVLEMVSKTVNNASLSRAIDTIAANVREGKGISGPMSISGIFPPMVVQMVAIGEETGKVEELLLNVAEYYDQQSDYMMQNLSTMIEPIFIFFLGAMVLVMALALFLPMWNLITVFKG